MSAASSTKPISASNRLYDIPSLENDGSNFQTWKYRINTVLDVRGLIPLVDGTEVKPTLPLAGKSEDILAAKENITDWERRDKEARAQITLTLKDEPLSGVIHATTAADVWDKLLRRYEGKGKQTVAFLTGEIFRGTFTDETALEPQLTAVRHKAYILKTLNHELSDALIAIALIISLPESYSTLRTILMTTPEEKLTTDGVVTQVLTEEKSRQNSSGSNSALLAHTGKGKGTLSKSGKKEKSSVICHHCKKKGHIKTECRKLKAETAKEGKISASGTSGTAGKEPELTAKIAKLADTCDDNEEFIRLFLANGIKTRMSLLYKWVIDSGCTSHMTSHRHWFINYTTLAQPRRVWLGDESFILAVGIGRIAIKFNLPGGESLNTVLPNVYHVPDLHGNLMSVSRFTQAGISVSFQPGGGCNFVRKSDNVLIGQAHMDDNLYLADAFPHVQEHAYICTSPPNLSTHDLDPSSEPEIKAFMAKVKTSKGKLSLWHERFGHAMANAVRKLFCKKMVTGMEITEDDMPHGSTCVPCLKGKQTRTPIPKVSDSDPCPHVLYRMFSDLCGPMQTTGYGGEKYFMPLIDATTHYVKVENMRLKSETFARTSKLINRAEIETGQKVNFYHTDGGGEFTSAEFRKFLEARGIHHEITNPDTPQENGVAERMIRTLVEMARTLLKAAGLPDTYWPYAVTYAAYIVNRIPTRALSNDITPYEAYYHRKPNVSHLRVFGCKAYVHVPDKKRDKFDAKSLECIHLGYSEHKKAFILLHKPSRRIIESRDVHFDEGHSDGPSRVIIDASDISDDGQSSKETGQGEEEHVEYPASYSDSDDDNGGVRLGGIQATQGTHSHNAEASGSGQTSHITENTPSNTNNTPTDTSTSSGTNRTSQSSSATSKTPRMSNSDTDRNLGAGVATSEPPAPSEQPRRPVRTRRAPLRDDDERYSRTSYTRRGTASIKEEPEDDRAPLQDAVGAVSSDAASDTAPSVGASESAKASLMDANPLTYEEAMSRPDAQQWKAACTVELEEFIRQNLFTQVPRPENRRIVGSKWVFKRKLGPDGSVQRYKARLVAKGFSQVEGVDYDQTFSPVTRYSTIRTLLALAACHGWTTRQFDAKSAFTNPKLDRDIFMKIPAGATDSPVHEDVWKLNRALYGLKQASREWYQLVYSTLTELGYKRSSVDHGVFYKNTDGVLVILAVYVDDFMGFSSDKGETIDTLQTQLKGKFDLVDLGEISWILGMHVERDPGRKIITLSHERYIESILERFGFQDARPMSTPMDPNTHLPLLSEPEVDVQDYQSRIGSLMHTMVCLRWDIAQAVGAVARHTHTPGQVHLDAVNRIFRYLRGTSSYVIVYDGNVGTGEPTVYSDSDWAGDHIDRKSTTGYLTMLSGGPVSWASKKQTSVSTSSTEAEFIAGAAASQEALWLRHLLTSIGFSPTLPTPLLIDNQSAIHMIKNGSVNERTKHIDIKYRFICDLDETGSVQTEYVPTGDQFADTLTKPLPRQKFQYFLCAIGLRPRNEIHAH